ncbi:MAG: hypothetical protein OXM02_04810 [Bacteroidota bacterium]|nr:hypothetical protein [Bacteroidota bacterium]
MRYHLLIPAIIPALLASCQTEPGAESDLADEVIADAESDVVTATPAESDESLPRWPWPVDSVAGALDMGQLAGQAQSVLGSGVGALDGGSPIAEPVPTDTLRGVLPANIGRFARSGHLPVASAIPMVNVSAQYGSEDEGIRTFISDMALVAGLLGNRMPFVIARGHLWIFGHGVLKPIGNKEYPYHDKFE